MLLPLQRCLARDVQGAHRSLSCPGTSGLMLGFQAFISSPSLHGVFSFCAQLQQVEEAWWPCGARAQAPVRLSWRAVLLRRCTGLHYQLPAMETRSYSGHAFCSTGESRSRQCGAGGTQSLWREDRGRVLLLKSSILVPVFLQLRLPHEPRSHPCKPVLSLPHPFVPLK